MMDRCGRADGVKMSGMRMMAFFHRHQKWHWIQVAKRYVLSFPRQEAEDQRPVSSGGKPRIGAAADSIASFAILQVCLLN